MTNPTQYNSLSQIYFEKNEKFNRLVNSKMTLMGEFVDALRKKLAISFFLVRYKGYSIKIQYIKS